MAHQPAPPRPLVAALALATLLALTPPAAAQTVAPPYNTLYTITDLGAMPGLPTPYGGLTFLPPSNPNDPPSTLLIGGSANNGAGVINQITVTRDANNHVTGFSGTSSLFASAPQIDGGLAYGPGGVLFYTGYPNNTLYQIKPGSTAPDRFDALPSATQSVGALAFVPGGFPGAGGFHILSYNNNGYFTASLTPDGNGTYIPSVNVPAQVTLSGGLEGLAYVPLGSPGFVLPSVLIAEYGNGKIATYTLDANGIPIPASRQDFITGLTGAEGSLIDPTTGDFLFSTFGSQNHVIRVSGFVPVPEPAGLLALGADVLGLAGSARRRWIKRA